MPSVRKTVAVVAVLAAAGSTTGAAGRADVYAPPSPVPALSASTLDAHYQATARDITRALGMARHFHDPERARALSALLAPGGGSCRSTREAPGGRSRSWATWSTPSGSRS